jgi:chromosome segregation ATPase
VVLKTENASESTNGPKSMALISKCLMKGHQVMKKRILYFGGGATAVLLLMALLFGSDATSYLTTSVASVRDSVKSSVPVNFELERARQHISEITPEVRKNMELITGEEVEIEKLEEHIQEFETKLSADQKAIIRLNSDLASGSENFVYTGNAYTAKEVKRDLETRFEEYKTDESTLQNLERLLTARMSNLNTARNKLADMQGVQRKLRVQIDNLAARNRMIEVTKSSSQFVFDDSQLAKTSQLIDEIDSRLSAEERMANSENRSFDRIPVQDSESQVDLMDEITNYFGNSNSGDEVSTQVVKK